MQEIPTMPSFDVVSEVDMHEVTNAVDQANREVRTRFDFKGTDSSFAREDAAITMKSESEFQLKQMLDILQGKLNKRGIDIACLSIAEPELAGKEARQVVTIRQGLETELSRKIVKMIKDSKTKVQAAIQGDKVRVTGKKRDDLQHIIASLREAKFDMPLQYVNFRD
jgi:cyclic-di-GMP-binding protein